MCEAHGRSLPIHCLPLLRVFLACSTVLAGASTGWSTSSCSRRESDSTTSQLRYLFFTRPQSCSTSATPYVVTLYSIDVHYKFGASLLSEGRKAWQNRRGRHRSPSLSRLCVYTECRKGTVLTIKTAMDWIERRPHFTTRHTYTLRPEFPVPVLLWSSLEFSALGAIQAIQAIRALRS